jgi:hypothetical protein
MSHMEPRMLAVTVRLCKEVVRDSIALLYSRCELEKLEHALRATKDAVSTYMMPSAGLQRACALHAGSHCVLC